MTEKLKTAPPVDGAVPNDIGCSDDNQYLISRLARYLAHHDGDLENDRMVELPQVETRELLDFFKAVDQRVAVYEQLARGLRRRSDCFQKIC